MENYLTLLPKQQIKIKQASLELFKITAKFKKIEEEYKQKKQELQSVIFKRGYDEFAIDTPQLGRYIKVKPVESYKVIWDVDKLNKKLDKEVMNQIVDKTYTIADFDGLIKYLKSCGVNPKKFASYLNIEKKVNNKKIDELGELGEITLDDIQDCYKKEKISEYIKFSEVDTEGEEIEEG